MNKFGIYVRMVEGMWNCVAVGWWGNHDSWTAFIPYKRLRQNNHALSNVCWFCVCIYKHISKITNSIL